MPIVSVGCATSTQYSGNTVVFKEHVWLLVCLFETIHVLEYSLSVGLVQVKIVVP